MIKTFVLEDDGKRGNDFMALLPNHSLTICNNAQTAIEILSNIKFDVIFLDHDLGGQVYVDTENPNTGTFVVRKLSETVNTETPVVVHSWNAVAAQAMADYLKEHHEGDVGNAFFASMEFKQILKNVYGELGPSES